MHIACEMGTFWYVKSGTIHYYNLQYVQAQLSYALFLLEKRSQETPDWDHTCKIILRVAHTTEALRAEARHSPLTLQDARGLHCTCTAVLPNSELVLIMQKGCTGHQPQRAGMCSRIDVCLYTDGKQKLWV